ncbi:hypothetical protein AMECASPLE_005149 [Ameca splendens]|uniref:Uncharacterized protein n=1 Tax=Ameca splendens TaxID=208324 RepID=A0ABV0ZJA6_9TELE
MQRNTDSRSARSTRFWNWSSVGQLQERDDDLGAYPRNYVLFWPTYHCLLQLTACHAINKSSKKAAMQWGSHSVLSGSQCVDGRHHLLPFMFLLPEKRHQKQLSDSIRRQG